MWSLAVLASLQVAAAQDSTLPKPVDDASQSQKVEGTADEYLQAFEDFVQKFHKHYDSAEEKDRRLKIFSKNMAWVRQRNSEDHNYTVGITPFADLSPGEFRDIYGMQTKNLSAIWGGLPQVQEPQGLLRGILSGAPDSVDWRSKGAVSVVQQQGHCGACWTFATAGAIEGAWKVAGGNLYTLSEQQLLDCAATDYGNMGCKGGNPMNGFTYVRDKGLCTARSYNYKAVQGSCEASRCEQVIPPGGVRGYMQVAQLSENALMQAVAQQPVAVAIDGDSLVFQLYTGGILGGDCGAKLDHGVLLIGYGSSGGQNYWIIKNSWGVQWGENGFGRLARGVGGSGECGILSDASYAVLDKGKVVPGTFDPDPGTVAALLLALLCACCVAVFIYTQFCKRRQRRDPLLSQPTPQAPSTRVMPNPWARQAVTPSAQQAVTPSVQRGVMTPSAPTPSGSIVAQPVAAQPPADAQARTGNSAQSRLLQNK